MAFRYYGYWSGPGWSDNHFTAAGEVIDFNRPYFDEVDKAFRDHDHRYFDAANAFALSEKNTRGSRQFLEVDHCSGYGGFQ
jgi:hypothetical protein